MLPSQTYLFYSITCCEQYIYVTLYIDCNIDTPMAKIFSILESLRYFIQTYPFIYNIGLFVRPLVMNGGPDNNLHEKNLLISLIVLCC